MTRAAIYARYSSDKQREASIEDQVRLCEERAAREGWVVHERYCRPRHLRRQPHAAPRHPGAAARRMAGRFDSISS